MTEATDDATRRLQEPIIELFGQYERVMQERRRRWKEEHAMRKDRITVELTEEQVNALLDAAREPLTGQLDPSVVAALDSAVTALVKAKRGAP